MNTKRYSELIRLQAFEDRFRYLQLHGTVGMDTFGFDRYLNQDFYQSREWRQFRDKIIVRDMGCDLAHPEHEIADWVIRNGKPIRHYYPPSEPADEGRRAGAHGCAA